MADLYGPAILVRRVLPAEIVAQCPEWLRPMVGARRARELPALFPAFEIGAHPTGSWFVLLATGTQAPPPAAGFRSETGGDDADVRGSLP